MKLVSLASGSNGNCAYVGTEGTHILVDAGCSKKRIEEGLSTLSLSLADINAIFITHEHADHIASLHTLLKKYRIPVYLTRGTGEGVLNAFMKNASAARLVADTIEEDFTYVRADEAVSVGDVCVAPLKISHDALEPVAYRFSAQGKKVAVATDMGCFNDYIVQGLQGMDALLLEANHDIRMLQTGPYPYPLKQRILGDKGHLSNEMSGELLNCLLHDQLKGILLGHLSEHNNYPALAYETVRLAIEMGDTAYHGSDFPLYVASRTGVSEIIEV